MRLHSATGKRLYLSQSEREGFLKEARKQRPDVRTFAETLAYSGCRISEALELTPERVELEESRLVLRSLKKRRQDVYRVVPVPAKYIDTLNIVHGVQKAKQVKKRKATPLWPWTRRHGGRIIKQLMIDADIPEGPHRCAKGLRHSYGVNAIVSGVPLHMLSKWMGHSQIKTTSIYANAVGEEETDIAGRMWAGSAGERGKISEQKI